MGAQQKIRGDRRPRSNGIRPPKGTTVKQKVNYRPRPPLRKCPKCGCRMVGLGSRYVNDIPIKYRCVEPKCHYICAEEVQLPTQCPGVCGRITCTMADGTCVQCGEKKVKR